MEYFKEYIWYSGDWKRNGNNHQVPYNGVKITANANYAVSTRSPKIQRLVSVSVKVADYTYNIDGTVVKIELLQDGLWYDIIIPESDKISSSKSYPEFTLKGLNEGLGRLRLETTTAGVFLNIQFKYGEYERNVMGYIM
jgi:hypothetical protein